ncbi:MAG: hypothetical protein BZ138_00230, partial [Methanosphaera sp. rholeuAM270]
YTDVKRQIIPNSLTFSTLICGIFLTSLYFFFDGTFRLNYYLSILAVFIFSYILWRLGVWAGGDVKLFTAISSLLIPEFLDVLPTFVCRALTFPIGLLSFGIPTFLVMVNSVFSIIPIILAYVTYNIIKNKPHLIQELKKSFNLKEAFISLNSLTIAYHLISMIGVYHVLIKLVIILLLSYVFSRIMKYDYIMITLSLLVIYQQTITNSILIYLESFILLSLLLTTKNVYHNGIISEVLTDEIDVSSLEEGMILKYPLYSNEDAYYFDKSSFYDLSKEKGKLICSNNPRGVSKSDMELLRKYSPTPTVKIKKGLPFAPFVLSGLLITLTVGNTSKLIVMLLELI